MHEPPKTGEIWTLTRIPRKEMHSATTYIWRITDGKRHADVDGFGQEEEAERFARWLLTVMNAAGGVGAQNDKEGEL
jgi:hypothetical protein